jgi:hypothetical protein
MPERFRAGRDLRRSTTTRLRAPFAAFKPGGLKVQELPLQRLSDEQAHWLKRILESRPKRVLFDQLTIPDAVQDVLVEKGLVRRWRNGAVEITLDGIREVTRRPLANDETALAATANSRRAADMNA